MINFMIKNKSVIGVLAVWLVFGVWSNASNATERHLKENTTNVSISVSGDEVRAIKVAFGVSNSKEILAKHKHKKIEHYKNATKLTDRELKELLYLVGFRGQNLKEAWAIAKKESGGRPLALNQSHRTGDSSYGLFQINMIGDLGPDRREKFNLDSNVELFNPVLNAQIAYYMSRGGENWISWKGITHKTKQLMAKFPH